MRLVDAGRIQYVDDVIGGARLRIGIDGWRNIRRRKPPRRKGDAAMATRKEIELWFPAPVIATELMDENDRRARSRALVEQPHTIACRRKAHRKLLQGMISSEAGSHFSGSWPFAAIADIVDDHAAAVRLETHCTQNSRNLSLRLVPSAIYACK